MSAAATSNWEISTNQNDLAKKQAELVGCPTDNSTIIVECLRTKDANQIAKTYNDFFTFLYDPILVWGPVIEPDCGQVRFLERDPAISIQKGLFLNVPLIIGITEYEFASPAYVVVDTDALRDRMNQEWYNIAPVSFLYERGTSHSREISTKLKDFYLKSMDIQKDDRSTKGLSELYADGVIGFGVHRFVNLMAKYSDKDIFYYKFSYKGRYSHFTFPDNTTLGAVHHDDLLYLFFVEIRFPKITASDPEYTTVERMTTMWTNFAKSGNPTPTTSTLFNDLMWPKYTETSKNFLNIGTNLSIESCLYCERYNIWDNLFPIRT